MYRAARRWAWATALSHRHWPGLEPAPGEVDRLLVRGLRGAEAESVLHDAERDEALPGHAAGGLLAMVVSTTPVAAAFT